jgi:hypothetical protein
MARSPGRRMRSLLTFLLAATTVPLLAQQERTLTIPNIKIQGEVMNLSWTGPTGAKLQADVAEYCTSIRSHMCTPLLLGKLLQNFLDELEAEGKEAADYEGHSSQLLSQMKWYASLAALPWVQTVCEIGFNAGHSAATYLATKDSLKYRAFDIGVHGASRPAAELLEWIFGESRISVAWGDSARTVPLAELGGATTDNGTVVFNDDASSRPPLCCDLAVVDGAHTYDASMLDVLNFARVVGRPDERCRRGREDVLPLGCGLIVVDDILSPDVSSPYDDEDIEVTLSSPSTKAFDHATSAAGNNARNAPAPLRELARVKAEENELRGFAIAGAPECTDSRWQLAQVKAAREIAEGRGRVGISWGV